MPTDNAQTIERFYGAFARLDADTMAACYAPDASFDDEAFSLRGVREIGGMWRMLCGATKAKGADVWHLSWRDVRAEGNGGQAHWDARFGFTPGGLIATHRDSFSFWAWSRQALGAPGLLLGWSPMLRSKVRATAAANLSAFLARQP